jgi:CRP/FNR family transcriptional regulator, cyclic AMP receptor protein
MADGGPFNFKFLEQFGVPFTKLQAGHTLFRKGDKPDAMYLVISGAVEIRLGEQVLERASAHSIVGEMALLDQAPRSASAVTVTASEVAVIDRMTFLDLVREDPSFSLFVMHRMANRIRRMNDDL